MVISTVRNNKIIDIKIELHEDSISWIRSRQILSPMVVHFICLTCQLGVNMLLDTQEFHLVLSSAQCRRQNCILWIVFDHNIELLKQQLEFGNIPRTIDMDWYLARAHVKLQRQVLPLRIIPERVVHFESIGQLRTQDTVSREVSLNGQVLIVIEEVLPRAWV